MTLSSTSLFRLAGGLFLAAALAFSASPTSGLTAGKADLKSAAQITFGPDGIMFVGDSVGAAVFAIDTEDTKPSASAAKVDVKGINEKIAALLGTSKDQILINDVKVNPLSKNVYVAVSRGRGPDAAPVILRVDGSGKITEFPLNNVKFSTVSLPDAPENRTAEGPRAGNGRMETITDMAYLNGSLIVAGLSNEEFSSDLRSIPFPFHGASKGSGIEIWHGSHAQFETAAPVRTFVPYTIGNQQYILAAYTCTPLVKIPVSALKPGAKVKGTTIAELGAGNRPLDMVAYRKDGHDYILLANSSRGVMKLSADKLDTYKPITQASDIAGVPYQTVAALKGVQQLEKYDDGNALLLTDGSGSLDLKTIPLP